MRRAVAATLVALALPAAAARAATVAVYVPPCAQEQAKYGQCDPDQARFTAAPGEQNDVTITRAVDPPAYQPVVTIKDDGAPLSAGSGCRQDDDHTATCAGYNLVAVADAGDGNDTIAGPGFLSGGPGDDTLSGATSQDGGPGDDHLIGSDQADRLIGGPGHDTIEGGAGNDTITDGGAAGERDTVDGGAGNDTIDYSGRAEPVVVSLLQPLAGEDALAGIENLRGGDANDRLTGDAGPNTIDGGPGNDIVSGGDGADKLYGDGGADTLQGGGGDDQLDAGTGAAVIECGAGADRAAPGPSTLLRDDCERVGLDDVDFGGPVRLALPLARAASPFVAWDSPSCLDRPCSLAASATAKGRIVARFSLIQRRRGKLPRHVLLSLNDRGRGMLRRARILRVHVRIAIDDGGDRASESFLIELSRR